MSSEKLLKVSLFLVPFLFQISWIKCNEEVVDDCTIRINSALTSESFLPNQDDGCETVFYEITSKESSIIYIRSSSYLNDSSSSTTPTYINDTNNLTPSTYLNDSSTAPEYLHDADAFLVPNQAAEKISVQFEELSFLSSGENSTVVMDMWYFTNKNFTVHRQYLSRTRFLRIHVKVTGNWSGSGIRFFYKEVEFNVFKSKTSKELGEISMTSFEENFQDSYHHPNSAYIFQILKTRNINASSISLNLKFDINEGIGEYLLIGSGAVPFHGPPPLFIANDRNEKKFQVNDENAYIVYVATSSLKKKSSKVFSIRWKHRGSKITVDEVDDPVKDDVLQSIQVCIYNITSGLEELKKPKTEQFKPFKEELAAKSNELLSSMKDPQSNISSSRISFYRLSAIDKSEKIHKDGILYVMLKVEGSSKGKAAFDREFLMKAFRSFGSFRNEDGYEVGECPKRTPVSSGFYAMIPIFCTIIFIVWIWNQNSCSRFFLKMEERGLSIAEIENNCTMEHMPQETAEENHYDQLPVSRLQVTGVEGRRLTMDYGSTLLTYTENATSGSHTNQPSYLIRHIDARMSGIRSRHPRPEYNEGFEDDEGSTGTSPKRIHDEGERTETEHFYDSLKSSKSVDKIYDTKL